MSSKMHDYVQNYLWHFYEQRTIIKLGFSVVYRDLGYEHEYI